MFASLAVFRKCKLIFKAELNFVSTAPKIETQMAKLMLITGLTSRIRNWR